MTPFGFRTAQHVLFGRGEARHAAHRVAGLGHRVLLVRGRSVLWVNDFLQELEAQGCIVTPVTISGEPVLDQVVQAVARAQEVQAQVVVAVGGGSVVDLGKAVAALAPASGDPVAHLEVVGQAKPLGAQPLPFVAMPTTAGTGAEVTMNAVISLPEQGVKVSLRDPAMLADLAIVDPALTDNAPRVVTLASGLDAVTQVIEPYLSTRANPMTDALCAPAIGRGLQALSRLMQGEDPQARDDLAYVSMISGMALANAGLGAVHGLAGPVGGRLGAPHGVICGRLLGPVLAENARLTGGGPRYDMIRSALAEALGVPAATAFEALPEVLDLLDLPRLRDWCSHDVDLHAICAQAGRSSSMQGNPVSLSTEQLVQILKQAM